MSDLFVGKRVLITGGLGFIGSNLASALVNRDAKVMLLDSLLPEYGAVLENIADFERMVKLNISDLRDPHSLRYLVQNNDYIFCLAGQVSHIDSMASPMTDLAINCQSQLSLLECCRYYNPDARIVFTSTRQVYGKPEYLPVDEKHPKVPVDINGINKLAAESYYELYARVYGLKTINLRLTNTYGPRMDLRSGRKGFLNTFLGKVLREETIQIFGDGEQRRDFNYVDDVVDALIRASQLETMEGGAFNLAHPRPCSINTIVSTLKSLLDLHVDYVPFPKEIKAIDIGDYYGSSAQFEELSGWKPSTELPTGLQNTIEFFRDKPQLFEAQ